MLAADILRRRDAFQALITLVISFMGSYRFRSFGGSRRALHGIACSAADAWRYISLASRAVSMTCSRSSIFPRPGARSECLLGPACIFNIQPPISFSCERGQYGDDYAKSRRVIRREDNSDRAWPIFSPYILAQRYMICQQRRLLRR